MKIAHTLIILSAVILFLTTSSTITSGKRRTIVKCTICHAEVLSDFRSKKVIHEPLLNEKCATCHIVGAKVERTPKDRKEEFEALTPKKSTSRKKTQKISWFQRGSEHETTHWLKFSSDQVGDNIIIQAKDAEGCTKERWFHLPVLEDANEQVDDEKAPAITDVEVIEIKRGVLISARIRWKTDETADSLVKYGISSSDISSDSIPMFSKMHEVELTALKPKKTYVYTVISKDIYGNLAISEELTFATDTFFSPPPPEPVKTAEEEEKEEHKAHEMIIEPEISSFNESYVLKINLDTPAAIAVGYPKGAAKTKRVEVARHTDKGKNQKRTKLSKAGHPLLTSETEINNTICLTCHSEINTTLSHPLQVRPRKGMIVPKEYPLADGMIVCMTCHRRHASDNPHRLIKSGKRELCIGCHKEMI